MRTLIQAINELDNIQTCDGWTQNAGNVQEMIGFRLCTINAAVTDALRLLEQAVARVEIANREGNPILSAWLPEARALIKK